LFAKRTPKEGISFKYIALKKNSNQGQYVYETLEVS